MVYPKPFIPRGILHHGLCSEEFEPKYVGTDYFTFFHKPCVGKPPYHGHSKITHVLIDLDGRIIFNLECRSCGFRDALKTHPYLWDADRPKEIPYTKIFQLSPVYKKCCRKHWWDNL
ncbi:MAG: hypothetical protein QXG39_09595 [Candidatus Aenigmatarchaeota archaeon]